MILLQSLPQPGLILLTKEYFLKVINGLRPAQLYCRPIIDIFGVIHSKSASGG
jgi:hypothetical protein